jgi:hypothetical protein
MKRSASITRSIAALISSRRAVRGVRASNRGTLTARSTRLE